MHLKLVDIEGDNLRENYQLYPFLLGLIQLYFKYFLVGSLKSFH
jgi:hypothetical protein